MDNHLADRRHIALILRLAIDKDVQLVYGEVIDLGGASIGHFVEWSKLAGIVQTWISCQGVNQPNDKPDIPETKKRK
jgi:hypothetical protein